MALIDDEAPPPQSARIAGDSSPSSAETTFRELDDVFLQTQTRIWLGEVFGTRLDEQVSISELLSDGELLCEVSRVLWEMLLTRRTELGHSKPFKYDPFASRKGSGRYTPYCNVDSFLKICKILGLSGIDVFSPSDVVEKKNTRKVCICIRLLSKKARSKDLNVPDFDIVTCTASMPTDMVGFIRRSLELSQCSSPHSARYKSPCHVSTTKAREKLSIAASANFLYSEDMDDTESNVAQSDTSHVFLHDMSYGDDQQDSPIVCALSDAKCRDKNRYEDSAREPNSFDLDLSNHSFTEEDFWDSVTPERSCIPCQLGISSIMDHQSSADDTEVITGSYASNLCSYEANKSTSSSENGFRRKFYDEYLEVSSVSSTNSVSGPLRMDCYSENDSGNSSEDIEVSEAGKPKSEHPEELDLDAELRDADGQDHVIWSVQSDEDKFLLTEANMSDYVDSKQSNELSRNDESNSSKSVLDAPSSQAPGNSDEYLRQSEATKSTVHNEKSKFCTTITESVSAINDQLDYCSSPAHATNIDDVTCDGSYTSLNVVSVEERKPSSEFLGVDDSNCLQTLVATVRSVDVTGKINAVDGSSTYGGYDFAAEPHLSQSSDSNSDGKHEENAGGSCQETNSHQDMNPGFYQGDMEPARLEVSITQHSNKKDNLQSFKPADVKPQGRVLIKSIVSGTAILSVMFLVLQFRKSRREKGNQSAPPNHKESTAKSLPLQNRRSAGVQKGIYPAEKLKLGK